MTGPLSISIGITSPYQSYDIYTDGKIASGALSYNAHKKMKYNRDKKPNLVT